MLTEIETRAMLDVESLTEHAKAEPKVLNNFENDQRNLYLAQKQNLTKERNDRILLDKAATAAAASSRIIIHWKRKAISRANVP